jgi:hypothetical protein
MSESLHISTLTLERYNLGEVTGEEKEFVEAAMIRGSSIADRLADIRRSDAEISGRYPLGRILARPGKQRYRRPFIPPLAWGIGAAALLLLIALPFFRARLSPGPLTDRIKGSAETSPMELRVYLKSDMTGAADTPLPDQTVLHAGNTIQLAYMVNSHSYGVIFSIDGRSAVTMHYPYAVGENTQLIPGKRIALDEAYTLDDAPNYELFFFVVSDTPLDVPGILRSAEQLARNPETALERSAGVFRNYGLKTLTLRKE